VKEHLAVPKAVRLAWGGLKNLLSGVTTVAHHNPYDAAVFENGFPVRVVKRFGWAHSLHFSSDLVGRYRAVSKRWPFLIHAAEGTDPSAAAEIQELERLGVLSSRTVLIHGVGIHCDSLEILLRRRASLVWCPSSNLFTLSQTLRPEVLRSALPICLGTDSALTCQGDLASELRVALQAGCLIRGGHLPDGDHPGRAHSSFEPGRR
jgi:cytosine/adenosine deaminase-related metal-dependent hydrolase